MERKTLNDSDLFDHLDAKEAAIQSQNTTTPSTSKLDMSLILLKLSIMPIIGFLFHPVYTITTAIFLGHMEDAKYLAGFGLGSLTLGICAISLGTMFAVGMGTKVAQAFGAGDYNTCRSYLYRQYFLSTIIFVVLCLPLGFVERIYTAIGQDPEISTLAAQYVHIVMPGVYFHFLAVANMMYCSS